MSSLLQDTIAARATPAGRGGVGIIRIAGKATLKIAEAILGKIPSPRFATFCDFLDSEGDVIDQGLAIYFKAPHSFTGDDVLELHGHGGPVILDLLLTRILKLGVRLARPGEFSERAFLNGKLDLTQAEAIADLIEASSLQAARSAVQSLQGKFSETIRNLVTKLIELRMYVEAAIDFPEEEVDFLSDGKILARLNSLLQELSDIINRAKEGKALNEGVRVVIAGLPNAGKSSLLNALSGEEIAIVSNVPGTTRDLIKESILIDGIPLHIIDTAGLRNSIDHIETEGIKRAWREIPSADRILLVLDAAVIGEESLVYHELVQQFLPFKERVTLIRNKIDLIQENEQIDTHPELNVPLINLSVKTGKGINLLKEHLKEIAGYQCGENVFLARRRHLDALNVAYESLGRALEQLVIYKAGELVAEELLEAQNALNQITGDFRSDDLLGKIFSSFCIGK